MAARCPRKTAATGWAAGWSRLLPLARDMGARLAVVGALAAAGVFAGAATAQQVAPPGPGTAPLVVATIPTAPFVIPKSDPPAGFSIDLWQEIARRMHATTAWKTAASEQELLQMVQRHEADVGVAAIVLTPERDQLVDFSHPYFDAGLQIMVRVQNDGGFEATLASVPWAAMARLFAVVMVVVFVLANVLWLVERRKNGEFRKGYLHAIGEGLWGTMLIIATGEHGDRDAPGVVKRIVVVCMWLLGVVLIAQLTATVTSSQTVDRLRSTIQGPEDLPGKSIVSVSGTAAGDYLTRRGLPFTNVGYGPDAIRMLLRGEAQAVVFDAPTLLYWAAREGNGQVQVVGPVFMPVKYAIAVSEGSALRKPINQALLQIVADGTYERLRAAWFTPK
jgi:polar amino acid transport system substrate-binding protein